MSRRARRLLLLAAGGLWLASLALPAVRVTGGPAFSGLDLLARGWSGWRDLVFAWFANPLLLLAAVAGWRELRRAQAPLALLAAALALSSFFAADIAGLAGRSVPVFHFAAGFYVWLAAHGLVLTVCMAGHRVAAGPSEPRG